MVMEFFKVSIFFSIFTRFGKQITEISLTNMYLCAPGFYFKDYLSSNLNLSHKSNIMYTKQMFKYLFKKKTKKSRLYMYYKKKDNV